MPQTLNSTYENDNSFADNFTKVEKRRRSTRIGRMKQSDLKVVENLLIFLYQDFIQIFYSSVSQPFLGGGLIPNHAKSLRTQSATMKATSQRV